MLPEESITEMLVKVLDVFVLGGFVTPETVKLNEVPEGNGLGLTDKSLILTLLVLGTVQVTAVTYGTTPKQEIEDLVGPTISVGKVNRYMSVLYISIGETAVKV